MANDNLHTESGPANADLAQELETLHERVCRMESLLRGAESVLSAVRYDAHLSYTPGNDKHTDSHRRAYQMIEFVGEQFEQWKNGEVALDSASDDIWELWERAKDGRLIRYGKHTLEPVE